MTPRATIDFETRSACSLRSCGAWRYSEDHTTEVLCLAYKLPGQEVGLWTPHGCNDESALLEWIIGGGLVEAHNAWFERSIWENIMVPVYGFPPVAPEQWRCTAAKAAAHALPRSLDDALAALKLPIRKDEAGGKVMQKMSKPRKPRKAEREAGVTGLLWWDTPELFEQLYAYCRQDVLAEVALSEALPDLSEEETEIFLMDGAINRRGFQLDQQAVEKALALIERQTEQLNNELAALTVGRVQKATQRAQLMAWLEWLGVVLPDTRKDTVEDVLAWDLPSAARRALEILQAVGRSSTAKYEAMQNWAGRDGKVRGGLLYHGASTGRWTGAGVQPHNFPRGSVKDMEATWQQLKLI